MKKKQEIGENEDLISQLIQQDLIDEFFSYVNQNDYPLESNIKQSIFETNNFLNKHNEITLIEYAAFFGSTQIFKYLYKNGVELTSSLWIYAIHSDNPEMISLLEENNVHFPNNSFEKCIKESIKCHHNDIVNYIQSNIMNTENLNEYENENIISNSFHYYNFSFFPQELNNKNIFNYACKYGYYKIVEYILKTTNIDINEIFILNTEIFFMQFK